MMELDPRITRNRARALEAAAAILAADGRDALTQARVAIDSGVSRATVYRLWPERPQLVLDALGHLVAMAHTEPGGHDPAADLVAEIMSLGRQLDGPLRLVIATLLEQAQHDQATAVVLDRLAAEGTRVLRHILADARRVGRLRPGLTVDLGVTVIVGSSLSRHLVERKRATRSAAVALARLVLTAA